MEYIKGFLALFILLTLLLYLVPDAGMKKYIRFFSEVVLAVGFLSPVLNLIGDSDAFLEKIEYAEFNEELEEFSKDMKKMEYIQSDYYLAEYEQAIEVDVTQIAGTYGFGVLEVDAKMNEDYTLAHIYLEVCEGEPEEIVVEKVQSEEEVPEENGICTGLKQELEDYYKLKDEQIEVVYREKK